MLCWVQRHGALVADIGALQVHEIIVVHHQELEIRHYIQIGHALDILIGNGAYVGDRVPRVALPIGRPSLLEGIKGAVNGAVAHGVHVHLNAFCIKVVYKTGKVFLRPDGFAAPMITESR